MKPIDSFTSGHAAELVIVSKSAARTKDLEITVLSSFSSFASEISLTKTYIRKYREITYCVVRIPAAPEVSRSIPEVSGKMISLT